MKYVTGKEDGDRVQSNASVETPSSGKNEMETDISTFKLTATNPLWESTYGRSSLRSATRTARVGHVSAQAASAIANPLYKSTCRLKEGKENVDCGVNDSKNGGSSMVEK